MKPKNSETLFQELRGMRCSHGLSDSALLRLVEASVSRIYSPRQHIWRAGDPADCIAILTQGSACVSRHAGPDSETMIGVFGRNDVLGISATLQKRAYPGTATVLSSNTEVVRCYLRPLIGERGQLSEEIHHWMRERLLHHEQVLRDKIDILSAGSSESRCLELVRQLIRRFGNGDFEARQEMQIYLTRAQVAAMIDSRVETTIRIFSRWKSEGWVNWSPQGLIVQKFTALERKVQTGSKQKTPQRKGSNKITHD